MTQAEEVRQALLDFKEWFDEFKKQYREKLVETLNENEEVGLYSTQNEVDKLEDLMFTYARIHDKLNWKMWLHDRGSMRKKVRKILGYIYP